MNLLARSACKETRTDHELSFKAFTTWILFYSFVLWLFFYFWNTKSGLLGGGAPNFSRGKLFLFKYKGHAESRVPVILHLIQVEVFRETDLIENVANTMSESGFLNFLGEDSPRPPPPPRNSRLRREFLGAAPSWNCAPPSLLMTLYGYFQRNQSRDDRLRCGRSTRY